MYLNLQVILFFQMTQSKIFKSSQYKKLLELKKASNFPVKPSFNPAILYIQDVLNPQNLTWDHPRNRENNLENTIKTAMGSWSQMNPVVKGKNQIFAVLKTPYNV